MQVKPLVTKNGQVERLQTGDYLYFQKLNLGPVVQLTVVSNAITVTHSNHSVFSASNVQLIDIDGGVDGDVLILRGTTSGDVSVRDNTGNLRLSGNFSLSSDVDRMVLLFDGVNWVELTRSNNG